MYKYAGFYYLASPYSKYPDGIEAAYEETCKQAALLIKAGVKIFSPITHSHDIAYYGGIDPTSHAIWLAVAAPFMGAAKGLIVCKLPSWETSYGIGEEIRAFEMSGKPVVYMEPGQVPFGL